MGPVFLFDVGIVIFVVRTGGSEFDRTLALKEEVSQMPVEEFRALIRVKAKQLKGKRAFDMLDLFFDLCFPFAVDSALLGPARGNIDSVQGVSKVSGHGITAMSDRIGFKEVGPGFIPLIGFDGDVAFEK